MRNLGQSPYYCGSFGIFLICSIKKSCYFFWQLHNKCIKFIPTKLSINKLKLYYHAKDNHI